MSRHNLYDAGLRQSLLDYSKKRDLELYQYSEYHFRLTDNLYTTVDIWTSRKYWIKQTTYVEWAPKQPTVERQGEKGTLPKKYHKFLDEIFFLLSQVNAKGE